MAAWAVFSIGLVLVEPHRRCGRAKSWWRCECIAAKAQQAADAIVALGKSSVLEAASDEEAINQAQMSIEALSLIGQLGKYDTSAQSDKLLDELTPRPGRALPRRSFNCGFSASSACGIS